MDGTDRLFHYVDFVQYMFCFFSFPLSLWALFHHPLTNSLYVKTNLEKNNMNRQLLVYIT